VRGRREFGQGAGRGARSGSRARDCSDWVPRWAAAGRSPRREHRPPFAGRRASPGTAFGRGAGAAAHLLRNSRQLNLNMTPVTEQKGEVTTTVRLIRFSVSVPLQLRPLAPDGNRLNPIT